MVLTVPGCHFGGANRHGDNEMTEYRTENAETSTSSAAADQAVLRVPLPPDLDPDAPKPKLKSLGGSDFDSVNSMLGNQVLNSARYCGNDRRAVPEAKAGSDVARDWHSTGR